MRRKLRLKSFCFWFTTIAIAISLYNGFGFDEKSILFFLSSQPFWVMETHWFVETFTHPSTIPNGLLYALTILFWFFIGLWIDQILLCKKVKRDTPFKTSR